MREMKIPSLRARAITTSDGESTFDVNSRHLWMIVVPNTIVPRLLSQMGALAALA